MVDHGSNSDSLNTASVSSQVGYNVDPVQLTECGHRCCRECFNVRAAQSSDGNVVCSIEDCQEITNRSQILVDKAFKRESDALRVTCIHQSSPSQCTWSGQLKEYQTHLDAEHAVFFCPDCQTSFPSRVALADHLQPKCPVVYQSCPLTPICGVEMIRRDQMLYHLLSLEHQEAVNKLITRECVIENPIEEQQDETDQELLVHQQEFGQKVNENLSELANKVATVTDETARLAESNDKVKERLQNFAQEIHISRAKVLDRMTVMRGLQQNQSRLQKDIDELHELVANNQPISSNGTLIWRIDHVADKMCDAQTERQTSIYSPVFYSSPTGYKMRARLFLFGDGNARRSHMSLFFLLMRGEYDAILKWPFSHRITFCLLDQTGANSHVMDSFQPDVKSNSFQRPQAEANVANGIPKFFPLTMIQQDNNPYVREDTMYLKVVVDLSGTMKTSLPYLLTLNPALPAHVQENLAQQENIRRQQSATTTST